MDPITILSVAAAAVAFLDFGGKIVRKAIDLLNSDTCQEEDPVPMVESLTRDAQELASLSHRLRHDTRFDLTSRQGLIKAVEDSGVVTAEVQALVASMQQPVVEAGKNQEKWKLARLRLAPGNKTAHGSSHEATKHYANKIGDQIHAIRTNVMLDVMDALWNNSNKTLDQLANISSQLEKRTDARQTTEGNEHSTVDRLIQERQVLVEQIWSLSSLDDNRAISHPSGASLVQAPERPTVIQQAILDSLKFTEMENRKEAISPAHRQTFHWIFESDPPAPNGSTTFANHNFVSWLEQDDTEHIYWITGRPGSGKSTLMKYILECGSLNRHLQHWSQGSRLQTAAYYTWNAGSEQQRSEEGLLRTLLHQYLSGMPETIHKVCPKRWAIYRIFGMQSNVATRMPRWNREELCTAFDNLLSLIPGSDYKIALFIDGLDEFQATDNFKSLLNFVDKFKSMGRAKVCVSSRDWMVFVAHFRSQPSLRMQDLTKFDISTYLRSSLGANVAYHELLEGESDEVELLIRDILDKANGVFLWVRLITEAIIAGMNRGDSIDELRKTVADLPPDLRNLYQRIWDALSVEDQSNAARLFLILDVDRELLDLKTMFLADQVDPAAAVRNASMSNARLLSRRLRSRTKGLLEVSGFNAVSYLHRTASDWFQSIRERTLSLVPPDFDPILQLLMARSALLRCLFIANVGKRIQDFPIAASRLYSLLLLAHRFIPKPDQPQNVEKFVAALDQLKETVEIDWNLENKNWYILQFGLSSHFTNTFLGLATQYCIFPYVRHKIQQNGQKLPPTRPLEIILLENAILSYDVDLMLARRSEGAISYVPRVETKSIERMIHFLLDHGADYRQPFQIFRSSDGPVTSLHKVSRNPQLKHDLFWQNIRTMIDDQLKRQNLLTRMRGKIWR